VVQGKSATRSSTRTKKPPMAPLSTTSNGVTARSGVGSRSRPGPSQLDERFSLRTGSGKLRFDLKYQSLPYQIGSGASFLLSTNGRDGYGPSFKIADWVQQKMQDPDGDGVPFFTSATETTSDNALVQTMTNALLSGASRWALVSRRQKGSLGLEYRPLGRWTIAFTAKEEKRTGAQGLGSGTYQRVTDVNNDGQTDSDYYFSVRGIELPALIDIRTTLLLARANYHAENWFFGVDASLSNFDNSYLGMTYDNPFWFEGEEGTSGSRRGLWQKGRASLEPSNEAWRLTFSGGYSFTSRTRLTAAFSLGEQSQDERFLPIATNPATIGAEDINRDGSINAADDPTRVVLAISGMPSTIDGVKVIGRGLDASSEVTAYNLTLTSRPMDELTLRARVNSYDYEGTEGIQVIPARTEYIGSLVELDWKKDLILHVPNDFTRRNIDLEATWRFGRAAKVKGFARRRSHDYLLQQDPDGNVTRDSGTRAVAGTDDDIFGVSAIFGNASTFSGKVTVETADRSFDGEYVTAFNGAHPLVRQFDIANRSRSGLLAEFDFMPGEATTISLGYNHYEDDYDDSEFGLQSGDTEGWSLNINHRVGERMHLFA